MRNVKTTIQQGSRLCTERPGLDASAEELREVVRYALFDESGNMRDFDVFRIAYEAYRFGVGVGSRITK